MSINKKRLKPIFVVLVVLLISLLFLYLSLSNDSKVKYNYINMLRLDSNMMYEKISSYWPLDKEEIEEIKMELTADNNSYLTIVDLNETIVFTNSSTISTVSDRLLLDSLYMDTSYVTENSNVYKLSQPIYQNDKVVAFAIFEKLYNLESNQITLVKKLTLGMFFLTLFALLTITAILLFSKNNDELKIIEKGLNDIAKGVLRPLAIKKNNTYNDIYNAYNLLIEELSYLTKKRQSYESERKAFLTMISHELKTPLATINAYIEGLVNGVAKDEKAKENYIAIISKKMQQLTTQVEDFFKYAQEDDNKFKYNFEECYADELLDTIFSSLVNLGRSQTKIDNILPKCIFQVDKIRLEQVIMNLYTNSLKHTKKDSPIILKAYREDNEVVVEIEDFGEGISPSDLPYIFDYYYQGQQSKTSDYEGVGLGLAICKAIMDKHNGSMKVKSNLGQGTTMYIKIPLV